MNNVLRAFSRTCGRCICLQFGSFIGNNTSTTNLEIQRAMTKKIEDAHVTRRCWQVEETWIDYMNGMNANKASDPGDM